MSHSERKKLLAAFLEEVWSQGRIEACDDFIGETYTVHHDPGDPWDGQVLSRDGFKQRVRLSREPLPDQRFTLISMVKTATRLRSPGHGRPRIRGISRGLPRRVRVSPCPA